MKLKIGIVFIVVLVVTAAAIATLVYRKLHPPDVGPIQPGSVAAGREITSTVHLYFSDRASDYLTAETRLLTHEAGPVPLGRAIVTALIAGPRSNRLPTLPEQAQLRAFYITDDATAYVDLSEAASEMHPGGAQAELMTVYSVVDSLILNIPEIQRVKILLAGREVSSLVGHIDLREPLAANMLIVR
jgi:hypothetical protein